MLTNFVVTEYKWPTEEDHTAVRLAEAENPTGDGVQDVLDEPGFLRAHGATVVEESVDGY